ncbi:uncharacterized protein LOC116469698 isoform X2 [Hylobates moloch]|uniref:uncharacterized protein LOC116469698 isoform X2 n=1 Tax=Hylobates moloch TaxID=81572 RepID=UPI00267715F1|nr:uncharacterized protein LOC116469698 isoform X2 [Hylobates moloch]
MGARANPLRSSTRTGRCSEGEELAAWDPKLTPGHLIWHKELGTFVGTKLYESTSVPIPHGTRLLQAVNGCCGLQAITLWAQSSGNADACVEEIVAGEERRLAAVLGSQGMRFWVCLAACGATWGLAARRGRAEDSSSSSVDASKFPWRETLNLQQRPRSWEMTECVT